MVEAFERQPKVFGGSSKTKIKPFPEQPPLIQTHPLLEGFLKGIITDASTALDQINRGEDPIQGVFRVGSLARMLMRASYAEIVDPADEPIEAVTKALPFGQPEPLGFDSPKSDGAMVFPPSPQDSLLDIPALKKRISKLPTRQGVTRPVSLIPLELPEEEKPPVKIRRIFEDAQKGKRPHFTPKQWEVVSLVLENQEKGQPIGTVGLGDRYVTWRLLLTRGKFEALGIQGINRLAKDPKWNPKKGAEFILELI